MRVGVMRMQKVCEYCGMPFEAKRSTARFCSDKCRSAYNRGTQICESVPSAISDARDVMHRLDALGVIGPVRLRPACTLVARGIAQALEEAGL